MEWHDIQLAFSKGTNKANSVCRTRRTMEKWLNYHLYETPLHIYFATFTFKDTREEEEKEKDPNGFRPDLLQFTQYLQRTCKVKYILNADYGKDFGRYHLHGFIATREEIPQKDIFDKYGYTLFKKANYFDLLTYCIKYSTKLEMFNKQDRLLSTRYPIKTIDTI